MSESRSELACVAWRRLESALKNHTTLGCYLVSLPLWQQWEPECPSLHTQKKTTEPGASLSGALLSCLSDCCKSVLPPVRNAATESATANWQTPLSIEVHHLGGLDFDGDEGQKGRKLPPSCSLTAKYTPLCQPLSFACAETEFACGLPGRMRKSCPQRERCREFCL